jgi:hypothetical protein
MAAGMGSRFGGLKQVEPFGPGGETLLDYSVYDALRAGFGQIVFVIRRDFEEVFRERVGRRFEARTAVEYVFQDTSYLPGGYKSDVVREKPWGTAHAVWCAGAAVRTPFAAINADDFYGRDAFAQLARFLKNESGRARRPDAPLRLAMAGYRLADTLSEHGSVSRGVCSVDARGLLAGIEEHTGIAAAGGGAGRVRTADGSERILGPDTTVSMNCWAFVPAVFGLLEGALVGFLAERGGDPRAECYLPAAIAGAMREGAAEVEVLPVRATWFGVTHRDDKPRVVSALRALVDAGEYPERLWSE